MITRILLIVALVILCLAGLLWVSGGAYIALLGEEKPWGYIMIAGCIYSIAAYAAVASIHTLACCISFLREWGRRKRVEKIGKRLAEAY